MRTRIYRYRFTSDRLYQWQGLKPTALCIFYRMSSDSLEGGALGNKILSVLAILFFPLGILSVVAVEYFVYRYVGVRFAVFGLYALLGLGVAAAIYYTSIIDKRLFPLSVNVESIGEGRSIDKIVYITCALTVATATVTQYPIIAAPGLLIAYSSLALQLYSNPTPSRFLPQLMAVFAVSPAIKQLTTGFYFGHGDLFHHVGVIEDLMASGSLSAISYSRYDDFPGLHVLTTAIGTVSDMGAYDSLLILGAVVSMSIIPLMYLFAYYLTESTWYAASTALAITTMAQVSFYSSYFFPQAFASILVLFLIVLAFIYDRVPKKWTITSLIVLISLTVIITHHLTQVAFLPMILVPSILYMLNGRKYAARLLRSAQFRIYVLVAVLNVLYLIYFSSFLDRLLMSGTGLIAGGLSGGYSQVSTYAFGRTSTEPVGIAVDWLISPYGIYMIVLLAVFCLGVIAFLRSGPAGTAYRALVWAAILASPIMFDTPISVKSLIRIRYPWMFLFTLVIALGLYRACRRYAEQQPVKKVPVVLVLIVIIGTAAPLVTADHYYGLDPRTTTQNDFSEQEYESLRSLAGFVRTYDSESVTTFRHTRTALKRFGVAERRMGYADVRRGELYVSAGVLIYRNQWGEHNVPFVTTLQKAGDELYSSRLEVSSPWLEQRVRAGNKVYDAGTVGMVWKSQDRPFEGM